MRLVLVCIEVDINVISLEMRGQAIDIDPNRMAGAGVQITLEQALIIGVRVFDLAMGIGGQVIRIAVQILAPGDGDTRCDVAVVEQDQFVTLVTKGGRAIAGEVVPVIGARSGQIVFIHSIRGTGNTIDDGMRVIGIEVEAEDGEFFTARISIADWIVDLATLEGRAAVVADDDIDCLIVAGGEYDVVIHPGNDDIRAVTGDDIVITTKRRIGRTDLQQDRLIGKDRLTIVAQHDVDRCITGIEQLILPGLDLLSGKVDAIGTAGQDQVIAITTKHHVKAITGADDVITAKARISGTNLEQDFLRIEDGLAIVTDHDIRAAVGAGIDIIRAAATKNDIGAVSGKDKVVITLVRIGGADFTQQTGTVDRIEQSVTVIADDHIAAIIVCNR